MAYNLTLTNGSNLINGGLTDGIIDNTTTSLTLVGKNYPGYGIFLNQNMVRLMENFANSAAPTGPLPGQLWWNSSTRYLTINTATTKGTANAVWRTIATMTYASSFTNTPIAGEQWFDTQNGQLKVWTGLAWTVIGPAATTATGNSGVVPDTIGATIPSGAQYVVLKFFINNELVGIWSKEESFSTIVPGFSTINRGLNLSTALDQAFYGNADVAKSLFVSGIAVPGSSFLRNDTSGQINGSLAINNDTGITFGTAGDFTGRVSSGTVTLSNQTNNKDFILSLKTGGVQTPFFRGNYQTGLAEAYANPGAGSPALSYATKNYVDNVLGGGGSGIATFSANIVPGANLTYNLGSTTAWWSNIYGVSIQALYADLAERFEADFYYPAGTVVALGGDKEITAANEDLSEDVFGVISTQAAFLMNGSAGDNTTHPPVAVNGRVPVRVVGKIKKGDRLVSAGNGLARAGAKNELSPWNVLGRSLQDKYDDDEGTIEAIVKLNS